MNLLEMKRQLNSVSQPEIHAALAEFEDHLIALSRRQKFTICPPRKRADFPAARAAIAQNSGHPKIAKVCG
jgi:hypothetical protein